MEKISNKIANKIAIELDLDIDRKEVIAYGTFALMQTMVSIGLVVIFGFILHVLIEALILSFSVSLLRKYSGGAHASSSSSCTIAGTFICIGQAMFAVYVAAQWIDFTWNLILAIPIFMWAFIMVYKLAPVDSLSKPIRKKEKIHRMKKASLLILVVYMLIIILIYFLYSIFGKEKLLLYSICIYIGVIWQVFTLTKLGHKVINLIDYLFNLKYIFKRRVE